MPYLHIRTNQSLTPEEQNTLTEAASREISEAMSKAEKVFMVSLQTDVAMRFAGTTEPAALAHLSAFGMEKQDTSQLTEAICSLLSKNCSLSGERIFVQFEDKERHMWGWDGKAFG